MTYLRREHLTARARRRLFSGQPDEWRNLIGAWGLDAIAYVRAGDAYRAGLSAELAARFARKSGLVVMPSRDEKATP